MILEEDPEIVWNNKVGRIEDESVHNPWSTIGDARLGTYFTTYTKGESLWLQKPSPQGEQERRREGNLDAEVPMETNLRARTLIVALSPVRNGSRVP